MIVAEEYFSIPIIFEALLSSNITLISRKTNLHFDPVVFHQFLRWRLIIAWKQVIFTNSAITFKSVHQEFSRQILLPTPGLDCDRTDSHWLRSSASNCAWLRIDLFIRRVCSSINIPAILVYKKEKKELSVNVTFLDITWDHNQNILFHPNIWCLRRQRKETSQYIHGVVEVVDLAWCLPWRWRVQTGIVDVTHHTLKPGQHASRGHGFIWVVA